MRIALIGDLHYFRLEDGFEQGDRVGEARKLFFETFMKEFLRIPADMHVSIGDLTQGGYPEEFEELYALIRESGVRFRLVLGNHDVWEMPKDRVSAFTGHPAYEAIDTEKAQLLFLDTTKEMWKPDWGGEIDAEQLRWLNDQIARSAEKPTLIFAHHPVWNTTVDSTEQWFSINPETDIQSVLQTKKGIGVYFNGHNHAHSIIRKGQWHYVQTAAALCYPIVRLIDIEPDRIEIQEIVMGQDDLLRGLAMLKEALKDFYFVDEAKAIGQESDRSVTIPLLSD